MPVQINIFLLLFGGLQGLLFTLFLFRRKLHRSGYAFLLLYFGVLLLQIVLKVMSKGWLIDNWGLLYQLSYQLPFLYGPLIFLFARQMTARKNFGWQDVFHFVPFALSFTLLVLAAQSDAANYTYSLVFEGERRLALQLLSLGIYHFMAFNNWKQYNLSLKRYFSNVEKLQLQWLKRFIVLSFLLCSVIALTIYFMYLFYPSLQWIRMGFLALTVFIYWVSYSALTQPDIFSVLTGKQQVQLHEPAIVTGIKPKLQVHRPAKKYNNSSLPEEEAARISTALEELMTATRPYLDAEITIDKLAKMVSSNRHHLSQVLNQKLGLSFYDYINSYRVNEARNMLTDPAFADHKIASIAYDAGFNSLSAFNDVFKKLTGQTPSQFRKKRVEIDGITGDEQGMMKLGEGA
jgi:AraC-like DNA-binding protein